MSSVKIGIIGGTGLDDPDILAKREEKKVTTPFGDPSDSLVTGEISGTPCVLLARHGRKHTISPSNVNYRANIWALKEEGCTHVLVTTACGSLREEIKPGDLVILDQFIDRTIKRENSFYDGTTNCPVAGICHLQMDLPFCEKTRQILISVCAELGLSHHTKGTTITIEGPRFSTKAESLLFRQWGGHIVNMTTVPEACLAKEAGLCYASIALPTDYDCWRDTGEPVNVALVMKTLEENGEKAKNLLLKAVPAIAKEEWTQTLKDNQVIEPHSIRTLIIVVLEAEIRILAIVRKPQLAYL
ncbi:PREDICTED: S-methyl-5'-thioadenosine phosphorylase-like [Amphimedon queenslandica]|uniref:S-methyl-5'-thioadenosine phosphorylase n=1 Tax=Amphimedon queenslandica TaxID=400682 RepID=A0AAN0INA9_AMPQE|nr:PREDICTED: S-methyl-5'-thioadenosine phosphorylase-like [Amphimedon queenslandica]|eukprot:XP_011405094.1 PREDICTED: S-methyl-5'-thioadenosine phosphorylase-like [Amphimedon queenslandica]